MDFLFQYLLFLAQAFTIVVAIAMLLVLAIGLGRRGGKHVGLEVTHLNEHYERMTKVLEHAMLPRSAFKEWAKARKAKAKAERKERKQARAQANRAGETHAASERPRLFVLDFHGDLRASGSSALREEVTAILTVAAPGDEVLVRLENGGGLVHGHGLAASQLARLRDAAVPLTVAIDKVAASGGYMMACVANRILAAPFAVVGSIGVLAQIPNFHRLLDRAGIDFELVKAGEHKRTLTVFGKNTPEDRARMQREIENVHALFKRYVERYRPSLDISGVATGEHWYGPEALERRLVDEIRTSDDYLLDASRTREIYAVNYAERLGLAERLASVVGSSIGRALDQLADDQTLR